MTVGIARVVLFLPQCHSLKEKRMVLRRLKDRVGRTFNVSLAEVGDNDLWQRATLGIATVGSDRRFVDGALDGVLRFVSSEAEVTGIEREVQTFNDAVGTPDLGFKLS